METPLSGFGTVQADFRITVVEANQVPPWCRAVAVSWKKGIKSVATEPAPVTRGRAEWNSVLDVTCTLCRSERGASSGQVQTKLFWLQLSSDENSLGHAQIDLSKHCDGQAHFVNPQIVKANHASTHLRTTLKISIQATRGMFNPVEATSVASLVHFRLGPSLSPSRRPHRPSSSSDRSSAQPLLLPMSGDVSPEGPGERQRTFSLGMSPTNRPAGTDTGRDRSRSKSGNLFGSPLHAPLPGPEAETEAFSNFASSLKELGPRLVSLCNNQIRRSGLTSVEQEDAEHHLTASLRRAREPNCSCGIVFTAAPLPAPGRSLEPLPEGSGQLADEEPLQLPRSLYSTPHFHALTEEESSRSGPARPLHDLLDRLSDIRALAMTLVPPPVTEGPTEEVPQPPAEDPLALPTLRGNLSHISSTVAAASAAAASTATRPTLPIPSHHARVERSEERDVNDLGQILPPVLSDPAMSSEADPPDAPYGANIEAAAATANAIVSLVVMSQMIVQRIDEANRLCQEGCSVVGSLVSQLRGVARDRELWIHRYLAHRELQYSNTLCERALTERCDEATASAPLSSFG